MKTLQHLVYLLAMPVFLFLSQSQSQAQNYIIDPSTDGGFEGTHGWTLLNTSNVNKWVIGTAQKTAGTSGAFVSNNNSTNTITNPQATNGKIYLYKDVIVPLNATAITVSFKYKDAGTDAAPPRCLFERTAAFPALPTDGASYLVGAEFLTYLNNQTGWVTYTNSDPFTTDRPATYSSAPLIPGQSYRIVFEWSATYQTSFTQVPPICVLPTSASISGNSSPAGNTTQVYTAVTTGGSNFTYTWSVTGAGLSIVGGQGTSQVSVYFAANYTSGTVGLSLGCAAPVYTSNGKTSGPLAIDEVSITYTATPKINSFSPLYAAVGSSVTISGEYFGATSSNNIVMLGGVLCPITAATASSITITVPTHATLNNFTVLNTSTKLSAISAGKFVPINASLANIPYTGYASGQNGSFEAAVNYTATSLPASSDQKIALADIDGDGKLDIVSHLKSSGVPQIYRNTSTAGTIVAGSLTLSAPAGISPSITTVSNVLATDLNNDGKIDIAASNGSATNGGFANINNSTSGTVSFQNYNSILSTSGDYKVATSFLPMDINLDGRIDILGISSGATGNAYYSRNSSIANTFSCITGNPLNTNSVNKILADGNFYTGATGDINGDGKPDVILGGSAQIYALQNSTTQGAYSVRGFTFTEPIYKATAGGNCNAVKLADLDLDGKLDVIATNASSPNISVFRNTSTGSILTLDVLQNFSSSLATGTYGLAVADMNGDAKPDLIFSNNSTGIGYLANTSTVGAISFAASVTIIPSGAYYQLEIADIDGDNKPDIIAAGSTSVITIFRNRQLEAGVISADQSVCSGALPAAMTSVSPASFASGTISYLWQTATTMNGAWTTAAGTATGIAYTPTATVAATTYYRRQTVSSTAPTVYYYSSPVTVTVTTAPTITGNTPATGCGTTTVNLAATTAAGNTIQWFTALTGGSAIGTGSPWTTPSIAATTTYYAGAITSNGCLSTSRTAVAATINTIAPTITSSTPASRCDAGSVTLMANASTSVATTINWYAAATGGSPIGSGNSFVTPEISTTTTYYVDAVNCIGTTASRTAVVATINNTPTISSIMPAAGCQGSNVILSAVASSGTLNWYNVATGGSASVSWATVSSISSTTTRWVSAISSAGSCESPRVAVIATMNALPAAASTTGNTLCGLTTSTVSATPPTNGSINWYTALTGGTLLGTGNVYTSPVMAATASYYAMATDANGCNASARTIATITYNGPTVGAIANLNAITNSTSQSFSAAGLANQTSFIWQRSKDAGITWEDITASLDPNNTYSGFSGTTATTSTLTLSVALPTMHLYQYRLKLIGSSGSCINYSNVANLYVADQFGACQSATRITLVNVNAGYTAINPSWSHVIGYTLDINSGFYVPDIATSYTYNFGSMTDGSQESGLIVGTTGAGGTAYITNYLQNYLTTSTLINQVYLKGFVSQSYTYGNPPTDGPNWEGGSIQVSTDNVNWTTVVSNVSGTGLDASGWTAGAYFTFPAVYARYVRAVKYSEGGLSEFYVFPADMNSTPFVKNLPPSPQNISTGATFSPSVTVTAASGQTVSTYQWSKSSDNITFTDLTNSGTISGVTTPNLTITSFAAGNIGYYKLTASQGNGCTIKPVIQAALVAPYYSSAAGALGLLQNVSSWNTNSTGTGGSAPADFAAGKFFILANAASTYTFGANWTVGGTLRMNGKILTIGNFNATIASILEAGSTAYVKTNGTGKLISSVSTTPIIFPVGNSSYNPVTITNNTGTTDNFSVSVSDAVLVSGSTGAAVPNVVNRTWTINKINSSSTAAGFGVNLSFQWSPSDISGSLAFPILKVYVAGTGWVDQTADQIIKTDSTVTYIGYKGTLSNTMFMLSNSAPTITSFTPTSAGTGSTVTITGTGLSNPSAVSFGGTTATSYQVNSGALNFDGTNDYVSIADVAALDLITNYTIECWIKPETFASSTGIVSKFNSAASNGYALRLNANSPYTGINFDGMNTATGLLVANKWYHIAATKSGATRKLYINGSEVTLTGIGVTTVANADVLAIGADLLNSRYFDGNIDEVRIWNTARTAIEIQNNMYSEISSSSTGLIAYYNFNLLTASNLSDLVASPKNGTLTNFALTGSSSNWVEGYHRPTQIAAVVAAGSSGSVSVTTPGGTASLAGFTFVQAPTISYFTPARTNAGNTVTITGTNFNNATTVSFGGTLASSFTVVSNTQITAVLRTGATGSVVVTTAGGTATKAGFVYGMPYTGINILAAWAQTNTSTQSFPYTATYIQPVTVSAANQNFSGLTKVNDVLNKWQHSNSSVSLDYTTAPYITYTVTTTTTTKYDRFVLPGLNMTSATTPTTKLQLRWSVDGYASSLGEFTLGTGASNLLSSVDLISTAVQTAGTVTFRVYMYNGNTDNIATKNGNSYTSIDGTAASIYDGTYAAMIFGAARTNPTLGTISDIVKNLGDPAFQITPPATNSTGALSYAINNASVATVAGSRISIAGTGTATLTASLAATDDYTEASTTAQISVQTAPVIVFQHMHKVLGAAPFTINAISNSGGAITYTSGTPATATISGNTVTLVAAGTTIITANQAANGIYSAATATAVLTVGTTANSNPTLVWVPAINKTMGNAAFSITAGLSCNSGGAASYYSGNTAVATLSSSTATLVAPGISILTAAYAANGSYNAGNISTVLTVGAVGKTDPTISGFPAINKFVNDAAFSLTTPTSNSTGEFFYISTNPAVAIVNGTTITLTGAGTCNIIAIQYANGIYNAGTISATLTVTQVLSYNSPNVYVKSTTISNLAPTISPSTVTTFSVNPALPRGLAISATTGIISGTPTMVTNDATYTVSASNTGGLATANLNIRVNDIAPATLVYTTPNVYTVGTGIATLIPTITGGEPTSYSIAPALPDGLVLNTITGEISGTPTSAEPITTYVVTASNTGGNRNANVVITINDNAPSLLTYSTPNVLSKGNVIQAITPSASGGAITNYSILPALPSGLALNAATGNITGTPTVVSPLSSYVITATNTGGSTTANLEILVNDAAPSNLNYTTPNVFAKTIPISTLLPTSTGGVIASYSIEPALPAGLTLNTATGEISGTPTEITAQATYVVTATNFVGTATANVVITVNDAPPSSVSYTTPNTIWQGCTITNLTANVAGGAATSYSVNPALPAGLSLNTTTGEISGAAINLMSQTSYVITASNVSGIANATIQFTVVSPTWTGNIDTDWNVAGNWNSNAAPSALTNILFSATASNDLILDQNRTIGIINFNGSNKNLVVGNYQLTATTINGASANSYIKTNGSGKLKLNIGQNTTVLFPVGNSAYNPVSITNKTGMADDFDVLILDEVYANGTNGAIWNSPRIKRTWNIGKTNANAGSGVDFVFNWNTGEEVLLVSPKFYHYEGGTWVHQSGSNSSTATSFTYTGFTGSFSPFAIGDQSILLPVNWLSFTAKKQNDAVQLNWSTASELNTKDYVVEHSSDGTHWNAIGQVAAAQNSNQIQQYAFIHSNPVFGNNFYRLLQRDISGHASYSRVVNLYFDAEKTNIQVYPNPVADGMMNVKLDKSTVVEMYNNAGILVMRKKLNAGTSLIDVRSFNKGSYILKANAEVIKVIIP